MHASSRIAGEPIVMTKARAAGLTMFAALLVSLAQTAPAQAAADKGDTAFLMVSTVLVLLMTIPGLALFYAGLVRTKNVLATLMQVFATVCLVCLLWILYGYSLAFTEDPHSSPFIGGLSKAFLSGVTTDSLASTFSHGVHVPEYAYIWFQMTFAAITPALIVGAFAERMRFPAILLFMALWLTFVYCPIAHMVWYWPGPDALSDAARVAATAVGEAKPIADANLRALLANSGLAFQWGALDFAGGTVVHINAGIAGLAGALMLGARSGYGREPMPPHSLTLSMVGAALLWVGWFGFNCGSNLEANGTAALAMGNTFAATAASALAWIFIEWAIKGKPTTLGLITGMVIGLVAVTPAAGFAGPIGAIFLGILSGIVGYGACTWLKSAMGYDDTLDVFGVHCVGGIVGALATGILVDPRLGGTGVADYLAQPGQITIGYDMATQMTAQVKAVALTLAWSGIISVVLFKFVDLVIGLRPPKDKERAGLDISDHGERGYHF
jgi:Amt family ammonium transporter